VLVNDQTPPTAWSDVISRRELERRQIYADFFEPHEIGGQMSFVFSTRPWIAITVNRRRDDFNADDRRLAALLRPHLRAAYRNIGERRRAARQASALEQGMEQLAGAVILLGPEGRIEHASALARDILGRWFASAGSARLPQALSEIAEGATFRRPGAVLRATPIATDPPLMLLDEERLAVDPGRIAALGLTAREGAVLELVAHGLSNAQIAGELYISPRTVHKHLQNSYAKLGVADRARAAALVLKDTI
jgi:DNA-binding NarL/FixJ family response regulator